MIISCIGHAEFLLEMENGMRIVTDPYDDTCGYPVVPVKAEVALVSHGHHDHNAVENVKDVSRIVDAAGEHTLAPDVKVTAVSCFHDEAQGSKRGGNLMFLIEAEGLRVAHLGDLGHMPTAEQAAMLAPVDVLMLPVGGFYTIDALTAREVAQLLQAQVILPMHYRTEANAGWPIAPLDEFLALYSNEAEKLDLLRISKDDMACQPALAVLQPQSLK
ncbi:MAG: MBL fold metallo-hydrolase [Clostridiales bacterium]|nr:MBL fold metallo-hydrolase [Clostridiales bacterium]